MTKPEVVSHAGPPSIKSRKNNVDRWLYKFDPETVDEKVKEIQFRGGKVSYKGDPVTPPELDEESKKLDAKVEAVKSDTFLKSEIERNNRINNEVRAKGYSNDLSDDVKKLNEAHYKKLNEDLEVGEIVVPDVKPTEATAPTKTAVPSETTAPTITPNSNPGGNNQ